MPSNRNALWPDPAILVAVKTAVAALPDVVHGQRKAFRLVPQFPVRRPETLNPAVQAWPSPRPTPPATPKTKAGQAAESKLRWPRLQTDASVKAR